MLRVIACAALAAAVTFALPAAAQQQRPQIETKKVDGTDNVYIFRNGGHQSMFVVTKDGVIATDPIAYGRPTGGQQYVDEIYATIDEHWKAQINIENIFNKGYWASADGNNNLSPGQGRTVRLSAKATF